ncbi:Papain fold toxin 1, glutamine deamidase [Lentzea xinjiangensis]|uniref:Papain fold toxin 1, glutamine deamidase n=1 Tax=Lentzea xinjiangensis TaxID=402600 RepID=A0A1H9P517_9PSEU|nr:toxin glutamine deamidase domain-containing protein [Lentzea xinjiangensis]SER43272.1 Papain fold toxin 1, glutamine deamidase [Lentzea xinjiangensis]
MLHPDPKVRERARFEQGQLDYIDSQRPSQPRERRDAHIVEYQGGGVSKTTNVNTGAVTVNGIPVHRDGPREPQLIAALQEQRKKSNLPPAGVPAPGLPQPPTAADVARNTTLHRDPDGGGRIVHKLPDGTTRNTDIRTGKGTVEDPRDHFVGNVLDEARETVTEGLMSIPSAIQGLAQASHDASVLDGTSPLSSDEKERRAAEERMKQRGDDVAHAVQNPGEVLSNVVRPYVEDLNSDKPERALGRAAVDVGSMVVTGGVSAAIKAAKAAEAVTGGRTPESNPPGSNPPGSNPDAAAPPQNPDPGPRQPGNGGPAPESSSGSPESPPDAHGRQNPADRPDSAPPAAPDAANTPGSGRDAPGTSSSSPNERDGRRTGVLPAPVTQPAASSRANRSDSTARRTGGDDSTSRRDVGTPSSRTSHGSESRQRPSDRTPVADTNASRRERGTAEAATSGRTSGGQLTGRSGSRSESGESRAQQALPRRWRDFNRPGGGVREPAIHRASVEAAVARQLLRRQYPGVPQVNARNYWTGSPSHTQNCTRCVVAVERALTYRGLPVIAGKTSGPLPMKKVADRLGGQWKATGGYDDVIRQMRSAGEGARGVVYISRPDRTAHVFNVVHDRNGIVFLDGQTGQLATLEPNVTSVYLLRYK